MTRKDSRDEPEGAEETARLDVWLDVTCLFPTRSRAAAACAGGKVDVNGQAAVPHRRLRVGDRLEITFARGRRSFLVKAVSERHVPKPVARTMYEETTPPVPPEVAEARRLERLLAPRRDAESGRLSHKERRDRERFRGY